MPFRLNNWNRLIRSQRHRSQSVVEFGVGVAAVAFVAMVGFNALGTAQAGYWGAVTPSMAAPTPAPGDFLHPTTVDAQSCGPSPNIPLGTAFTCTLPTVHDAYLNVNERRAPLGWIGLHLDSDPDPIVDSVTGLPIVCNLGATAGPQSTCTLPSWTPTATSLLGAHTLTLWYECATYPPNPPSPTCLSSHTPQSNHTPNHNVPLSVTIVPNYQFSPADTYCTVDKSGKTNNNVAAGSPIDCQVKVLNMSAVGGPAPANGISVTWSAVSPGTGNGKAALTCATGDGGGPYASPTGGFTNATILLQTLYATNVTNPCTVPGPSLKCTTGNLGFNGVCEVIYRRLPDNSVSPSLSSGSENLQVSMDYVPPMPVWRYGTTSGPSIVVTGISKNPAQSWINCTPGSATFKSNAQFQFPEPPYPPVGNLFARYSQVNEIHVTGTSAVVDCVPIVADITESTASSCQNSGPNCGVDPDRHIAFPPSGIIQWNFDYAAMTDALNNPLTCTLATIGFLPANQAPNGTPHASGCASGTMTLTLNGTIDSHHVLTAEYSGLTHNPLDGYMTPTYHGSYEVVVAFCATAADC